MLCIGDHSGHQDEDLSDLPAVINNKMNSLNERFEDRWAAIGERLLTHKTHIEGLFDVYYWALNRIKAELLKEEYEILDGLQALDEIFDQKAE